MKLRAIILSAAFVGAGSAGSAQIVEPEKIIEGAVEQFRQRLAVELPDDFFPPSSETEIPNEDKIGELACLSDEQFSEVESFRDAIRSAKSLTLAENGASFGGPFDLVYLKKIELSDRVFYERVTTYSFSEDGRRAVRKRRFNQNALQDTDLVSVEQLILTSTGDLWRLAFGTPALGPYFEPVLPQAATIEHYTCVAR